MIDIMQELADSLAAELQRSVAVDDPDLRLLVATAHVEKVDQARLRSLVGRRLVGPTRDYVMAAGARRWREPTRLEANADVGFEQPRWCFPLWSRWELLGFLWLIDDGGITPQQLEAAAETAQHIATELTHRAEATVVADVKVESLVRGLVADERTDRERAASELRDMGLFRTTDHLAVVVARSASTQHLARADATAGTVRRGIASAVQGRLTETYAYSAGDRESVLVAGFRHEPSGGELTSLATALHVEVHRIDPAISATISVGVGAPVTDLADVRGAFDQAVVAARVARGRMQVAEIWERHPLEGLLRACLTPELPASLLPSGLRALQEQPEDTLVLIAAFLANAGKVNVTADQLHLHRTTVYYRLAKFRERTGLDLDDGESRLLVHLWLAARDLLTLTD